MTRCLRFGNYLAHVGFFIWNGEDHEPEETPARCSLFEGGKPLKARCSDCGTDVRKRTVAIDGNETEVFCPNCQSSLLSVANNSELRRILARAATLISPRRKDATRAPQLAKDEN
jgi:DNA-directed RNA polymerase subunit RPC12/RpoP